MGLLHSAVQQTKFLFVTVTQCNKQYWQKSSIYKWHVTRNWKKAKNKHPSQFEFHQRYKIALGYLITNLSQVLFSSSFWKMLLDMYMVFTQFTYFTEFPDGIFQLISDFHFQTSQDHKRLPKVHLINYQGFKLFYHKIFFFFLQFCYKLSFALL